MGIVDPKRPAAGPVAQTHPGADPFDIQARPGARLVDRFLEPKSFAADFFEALAVEEDRTVFSAVPAVIPAQADSAVTGKGRLKKRHLLRRRFLDTKNVRLDLLEQLQCA